MGSSIDFVAMYYNLGNSMVFLEEEYKLDFKMSSFGYNSWKAFCFFDSKFFRFNYKAYFLNFYNISMSWSWEFNLSVTCLDNSILSEPN